MSIFSSEKIKETAIRYLTNASLLIVFFLSAANTSFGQSDEETKSENVLEEVTVTAQRRAESLQEVPIAVTAFTGEEMRKSGIRNLVGIAARTPSFTMGTFNLGQPQLYIRGIGSNADGAGSDSSVVVFLDEVYVGRATAANPELYDLERFEVLRGPQGTLFGKNVIGGVLNLITTKPTETFTGKFEATAGNLDFLEAKGLVSGPLSDRVRGKFSFTTRTRDGYVESVDPTIAGTKFSDIQSTGVRGGILFLASDTVEVDFSADYSWDRYGAFGRHAFGLDLGQLIPTFQNEFDPSAVADVYKTFSDFKGYMDRDVWGLMGRVIWQVGGGEFRSITAYRGAEYEFFEEPLGSGFATFPIIGADTFVDEKDRQFTQEFRFNRVDFNDRLNWTIGAYYLNEDIDRNETNGIGLGQPWPFPVDATLQYNTTENWSIFADATFSLTDNLDFTLGGRYTDESKDIRQEAIEGCGACGIDGPYDVSDKTSWTNFSPRAVLGFRMSDDIYMYASYTEGFKSGGYQGYAPSAIAAKTPFDPEDAKAYEGGIKSEWLDNRLRVNLALFRTDYTDLQVLERIITPDNQIGFIVTKNAGKAKIQGAELEFFSQWGNFGFSGNYAYLDTETSEFGGPDDPRNGRVLRNSPKNSYYLRLDYDWMLSNGGDINFLYEFSHKDKVYSDPLELEGSAIPAYDLQNLRIAYSPPSQKWELAAWVHNLADEEYLLHAWPAQPFTYIQTPAPPRTYGLTFSMTFGSY